MLNRKEIKNKASKLLDKLKGFKHKKKALALLATVALFSYLALFAGKNDPTSGSVMITNVAGNHGGTGVILDSNESESQILTNSHVCRVVEKGGLVTGKAGSFLVTSYKHSETHDICLITVAGNMKAHTNVASKAPTLFYESATVSGHPALYPNVITKGHFSGRRVIEVMTGVRKCTEEDMQDPFKAFICLLAGGLPEVKRYESILVTATIMPGSSGSAVYNDDGDLAGLVFAGSGNLGYAWTVPFEAVRNFLDVEQYRLPKSKPENKVDPFAEEESKKSADFDEVQVTKKLQDACSNPENKNKIKNICNLVSMDLLFIK